MSSRKEKRRAPAPAPAPGPVGRERLSVRLETWLKDQKELSKDITSALEKWIPKSRQKRIEGPKDAPAAQEKKPKKKEQKGFLERLNAAFVLPHRKIPGAIWRRAYNDGSIRKIGFMDKQGQKIKSWHKRLFVLRARALYYFASRRDYVVGDPPRGWINFKDLMPTKHGKVCQRLSLFLMVGKPHTFGLNSRERTLVINSKVKKDVTEWMEAIEEAYLAYWKMYDLEPPTAIPKGGTLDESLKTLEHKQELAAMLDALDLEEEERAEQLKRRLYLAKTFAAWKHAHSMPKDDDA